MNILSGNVGFSWMFIDLFWRCCCSSDRWSNPYQDPCCT